jgi:hypothetical protein
MSKTALIHHQLFRFAEDSAFRLAELHRNHEVQFMARNQARGLEVGPSSLGDEWQLR